MTLAADRDLVARQYANGFLEVFDDGVNALRSGLKFGTLEGAIIHTHLLLLAKHPDSLIARKCGIEVAKEASERAQRVLESAWPDWEAIGRLDAWLREDGHRRNPGATADLVAASLFVALRKGIIQVHSDIPWSDVPWRDMPS
jgi:triphosphoribosyl-dephospho-CoA synthase